MSVLHVADMRRYFGFILVSICIERPMKIRTVAVVIITAVLYASMFFATLSSISSNVSWESHLFGLVYGMSVSYSYFKRWHKWMKDPIKAIYPTQHNITPQQPPSHQQAYPTIPSVPITHQHDIPYRAETNPTEAEDYYLHSPEEGPWSGLREDERHRSLGWGGEGVSRGDEMGGGRGGGGEEIQGGCMSAVVLGKPMQQTEEGAGRGEEREMGWSGKTKLIGNEGKREENGGGG
eukprot:GHVQ01008284.1.p1 GENE.GHVQ01008284.1~~GHVQ01008284.1.p1  ORF type:complete len:235 (+),score=51.77 GHVQ01008284.1:81-785(+)